MRKAVLITGGVETLEFFSKEIGKAFNKYGLSVFYFDLKNANKSVKALKKFIKPHETIMISYNFQGLEQEEDLFDEHSGYIWDAYGIPCINIVVDHPMYYHEFILQVPKQYYHISIDRCHHAYMQKYYPEIKTAEFLPLAGTSHTGQKGKPIRDRSRDVIFTGNYTSPSFCDQFIYGINEEYAEFYLGIIKNMLEHPKTTLEDALDCHCFKAMGENTKEELRFAYSKSLFLDLYVRNYERETVVRTLAEGGIRVDVFGKDWEQLKCGKQENIVCHPQTDSVSCLKAIGEAKISLNVMPWFKDGAHDRIFNSMLNGAVSLTDSSIYLEETFTGGKELVFYDLLKLKELPELVKGLLADNAYLQRISDAGFQAAAAGHTWAKRAEWLLSFISLSIEKHS